MRNELTCINFEDSDCTIRGTNNVCVYNVGVFPVRYLGSMAGVFHPPYRLTIPSFWHKQFDQLTISLKFAKGAEKNTYILSTGQCGGRFVTTYMAYLGVTEASYVDDVGFGLYIKHT